MHSNKDPIVAVSTAAGRGGIGIVRLSCEGKLAPLFLVKLFGRTDIKPRYG